ncbi:hypothetical protein FIBSPDRAFT_938086 [Athelia psychrophila]|uniref:MI domain-containing protein n=1 Tax=Athelia psychrophila TaxID=1759441 RepID=A0A165ZAN1_9AGAM|nr:hypothetical protein FIBSPDRAFT_938086 [Fibularhizoctonia sp. CBS 109695]
MALSLELDYVRHSPRIPLRYPSLSGSNVVLKLSLVLFAGLLSGSLFEGLLRLKSNCHCLFACWQVIFDNQPRATVISHHKTRLVNPSLIVLQNPMSKPSTCTATAQKIPTSAPTTSAWAKGPPSGSTVSTPRSQSPAPGAATPPAIGTHSRKPGILGQVVGIKYGVSVPRNTVETKQGLAVTLPPHSNNGSISNIASPPRPLCPYALYSRVPEQRTLPGTNSANRLSTYANTFGPNPPRYSMISIKAADGSEVDLKAISSKRASPGLPSSSPSASGFNRTANGHRSGKSQSIRMESEEARQKRVAGEEAKADRERAVREAEEKVKKDAEEKVQREEEARVAAIKKAAEDEEEAHEEAAATQKAAEDTERVKEEETVAAAAAVTAAAKEKEEGEVAESPSELISDKQKSGLSINTAGPFQEARKPRPGPLDLSYVKTPLTPGLPSALATARIIEDIEKMEYLEGIMSPKLELNVNAKGSKFKYDRDFLLQFMSICKEKPDQLPPLDAIGLEPVDQLSMSRGESGRHRTTSMQMGPPGPRAGFIGSIGLGIDHYDVVELRDPKWNTRNIVAAPTTPAAVHDLANEDRAAAERESVQRMNSMSRTGSRRGGERGQYDQQGPDGGGRGTPCPPPKVDDLSNFGKINKAAPMTFGPTSVFAKGKEGAKGPRIEPISRSSSSSNMFSMLSQNSEIAADASGPKPTTSRPASRKTSIDLGTAGVPEAPPQRRKLQLLPRSKMTEDGGDDTAASTPVSENGEVEESGTAADSMSEADAKKHLDQDSKEFFAVRNLDEAEEYFQKLTPEHRFRLVDKLVNTVIESKAAGAQLVSDFFAQAHSKDLCSEASFEEGFMPIAELLDDIAIDAPKAFDLMAVMVKGASLSEDARGRIAAKSVDSEKLLALLST